MAKGAYIGVLNKAHKVKKGYIGVGGKARKIKKAYIGVGGKARLWWTSGLSAFVYVDGNYNIHTLDSSGYHDYSHAEGTYNRSIEYCNGKFIQCYRNNTRKVIVCVYSTDLMTWTSFDIASSTGSSYYNDMFFGTLTDEDYLYVLYTKSEKLRIATVLVSTMQIVSDVDCCYFTPYTGTYGGYCFAPDGENILVLGQASSGASASYRVYLYNTSNHTTSVFNSSDLAYTLDKTCYYNGKTILYTQGGNVGHLYYATRSGAITQTGIGDMHHPFNALYYNNKLMALQGVSSSTKHISVSNNFGAWQNTSLTMKPNNVSTRERTLAYGDGKYLFYSNRALYTSTDMITWTLYDDTLTYSIYDICFTVPRGYGDN